MPWGDRGTIQEQPRIYAGQPSPGEPLQLSWVIITQLTCSYSRLVRVHGLTYSRVHISSDSLFSKILKKPFIVQKKMIPLMNGLLAFIEIKQMADSFSSSANSQYFFMKISWIGPWVSRID